MTSTTPISDARLADIRQRKGEWGGNCPEMTALARKLETDLAERTRQFEHGCAMLADRDAKVAALIAALEGLAQSVAESQHAKPGTVLQAWLENGYATLAKVRPECPDCGAPEPVGGRCGCGS